MKHTKYFLVALLMLGEVSCSTKGHREPADVSSQNWLGQVPVHHGDLLKVDDLIKKYKDSNASVDQMTVVASYLDFPAMEAPSRI
jgi:hypothetical protein